MSLLIDTGTITTPSMTTLVDGTPFDTTASERVVVPNPTEQIVVVNPSRMVVLTAYSGGAKVFKVLMSNGIPASSSGGCCPKITSADSTILNRVELPCYELSPASPVTVIHIPGVYVVTPAGDPDDVFVTAMAYAQQDDGGFMQCCGNCS